MSVKLKAGSMELEAAFIEWLRTQGYNPADGIDPFFSGSEFVRAQLPLIHESEKAQLFAEARLYLKRRSRDPMFAGQFPIVYHCPGDGGETRRYTVALTLSDAGAEWIGRVWSGPEYLGEIKGSAPVPQGSYLDQARAHIESHIDDSRAVRRSDG